MEKPGNHCVIQRMGKAIMEDPSLKAVWLDARRRKVSFAFQPGADSEAAKKRLQQLAGEQSPLDLKDCAEDPWRRVCEHCEFGSKEPMPAGIRMLSMPDAGVLLEKETCPTAPRFWKWNEFRWIRLRPRVPAVESREPSGYRRELAMALACGAAGGMGFVSERWLSPGLGSVAAPVLYGLAYLCGAWHPAREVWELLRKRILDIHFLMLCVAAGAACIGHWWEGAMLLFLFSFSGALEEMALARTEREINSLFKESPKEAAVLDERGGERRVAVEELKPGMTMVVRPDEQFAADAEVIEGATAVNESSLTGESEPVEKSRGDTVYSGTLNLWGAVRCRVEKTAGESALAKVIGLIQEAQESKAPSQRFTDRFGTRYTYGILLFSFAMFLVWRGMGVPAFRSDGEGSSAFYRAMTLLVVASPCALVLSIPSAVLAGIASGARKGILFRGGAAIENLADAKRIVFDKTGTLTTGILEVVRVESFPPGKEDEVLATAAAIGRLSKHPVSQAVSKAFLHAGRSFPEVDRLRSVEGMGLTARMQSPSEEWLDVVMGRRLIFQREDWLRSVPDPGDGLTETLVRSGDVKGRILLRDQVRSSSRELVQRIRRAGLKVTMLTGDRLESARVVADALGLEDFKAELKPEDKVRMIQEWQELGERPVMIGDGVNDAPSLAAAQVGVAMGMRGSDAALEQADIVLMKDRLENFYHAYRLSRRARTIIRQNLAVSLGMVIVLVLGALGSALPLTLGVIGHEGSTVVVVFNSLRLLFFKLRLNEEKPAFPYNEKPRWKRGLSLIVIKV